MPEPLLISVIARPGNEEVRVYRMDESRLSFQRWLSRGPNGAVRLDERIVERLPGQNVAEVIRAFKNEEAEDAVR